MTRGHSLFKVEGKPDINTKTDDLQFTNSCFVYRKNKNIDELTGLQRSSENHYEQLTSLEY